MMPITMAFCRLTDVAAAMLLRYGLSVMMGGDAYLQFSRPSGVGRFQLLVAKKPQLAEETYAPIISGTPLALINLICSIIILFFI